MAVNEDDSQRLLVRVVFDGESGAGKSQNLRRIRDHFSARRRSELYAPQGDGPTATVDWLQLEAGVVGGRPLRCHLLSTPGAARFDRRRQRLLGLADVIVWVLQPGEAHTERAKVHAARLRALEVPLVLQLNDSGPAEGPPPLDPRATLGLPAGVPVIIAGVANDVGVRETFVVAIRAAADALQRTMLAGGTPKLLPELHDPQALGAWVAAIPEVEVAPSSPDRPSRETLPIPSERSLDISPPPPRELARASAHTKTLRPTGCPAPDTRPPQTSPPLPDRSVPSGLIWPAAAGREILGRLAGERSERRDDLVGRQGLDDGSGRHDLILLQAGPLCAKTCARRRYADVDAARAALLAAARAKVALASLLLPETTLAIQQDREGAYWLWTVSPWVETLRAQMQRAVAAGAVRDLTKALVAFAEAVVRSLALTARARLVLDVSPSNFAQHRGELVYIDDDVCAGERAPAIAHVMLRRLDEYGEHPQATAAYVDALARGLSESLTDGERKHLELEELLREAPARSDLAHAAKLELLDAVAGGSRSP